MIRAALLTLALTSPAVAQSKDRRGPSDEFFEGTYDIVGRTVADPEKTYAGRATLAAKDGRIEVARCIGGETTKGHITYEEFGGDRLIYLRGEFDEATAVTCQFAIDNDNYPRLACFLYPPDDPYIKTPGLEFFIYPQWTFPDKPEPCE